MYLFCVYVIYSICNIYDMLHNKLCLKPKKWKFIYIFCILHSTKIKWNFLIPLGYVTCFREHKIMRAKIYIQKTLTYWVSQHHFSTFFHYVRLLCTCDRDNINWMVSTKVSETHHKTVYKTKNKIVIRGFYIDGYKYSVEL